MFTFIKGKHGSGKSDMAERYVMELSPEAPKIYLATMTVCDEDGYERIKKHRAMREGRGFETIERPLGIGNVSLPEHANVLLEDVSNLLANELFMAEGGGYEAAYDGVIALSGRCENLTVVALDPGEILPEHDDETADYIEAINRINVALALVADKVIVV